MTTELYVSIDGQEFTRLDLMKAESINFKYTYKDTQDLSKIYSPYSQSFALDGSLNNLRALGFIGDTKVVKNGINNKFECRIYINGLLSKNGILKVTEIREEQGKVKSITANFTNNLLDLKTRMGDTLISDLSETVLIEWTNPLIFGAGSGALHNIKTVNGFKYFVPMISNYRVFTIDSANVDNPLVLDNIAYSPLSNNNSEKALLKNELAPAVQFRSIIDLIKSKYALNIEMPLEQESWYNDLYIYCNKQTDGSFNNEAYYDVINPFVFSINYGFSSNNPNDYKYRISANNFTNEFTITRNPTPIYVTSEDYVGMDFNFFNVVNLKNNEDITIEIMLENNGQPLETISITKPNNSNIQSFDFIIKDAQFDVNNEFKFKAKVKSNVPISFSNSTAELHYLVNFFIYGKRSAKHESTNNNSSTMGFNKINLYKSIPDIKAVDFLTSFLKMFNISIFESDPADGKLYFLTPKDINAENEKYSKKEQDYTDYVIDNKVTKKIANDYNYYTLKHKDSKWRNTSNYGNLSYPEIKPSSDLNEYKIETNFTIQQSVPISGLSSDFPTMYGFTNESPTVLDNGALRYKPNTDDLLIFFCNGITLTPTDFLTQINLPWKRYLKVGSIHEATGFSLGWGLIESAITESLYENYYSEQIERLLDPNTLQHTFTLELPPNELILNYANNIQGQSNIPDGFRLQNDIIIQERKFSIIDATIDQTTGKTTLTLLNYT